MTDSPLVIGRTSRPRSRSSSSGALDRTRGPQPPTLAGREQFHGVRRHDSTASPCSRPTAPVTEIIDQDNQLTSFNVLSLRRADFDRSLSDPPLAPDSIKRQRRTRRTALAGSRDRIPGPEAEIVAKWRGRSSAASSSTPTPGATVTLEQRIVARRGGGRRCGVPRRRAACDVNRGAISGTERAPSFDELRWGVSHDMAPTANRQIRNDDKGYWFNAARSPTVYLGSAPGVGKTYRMLDEGWRRRERGTDVVVAYVETHGRALTEPNSETSKSYRAPPTNTAVRYWKRWTSMPSWRATRTWPWSMSWRTPTLSAAPTRSDGRTSTRCRRGH